MNPSWEWLTWDPAVLGELDLSDGAKQWARHAVKDWRRAERLAREVAQAADAQKLVRAEAEKLAAQVAADRAARARTLVGIGVVVGGVVLWNAVPAVWRRWQQRTDASELPRDSSEAPPEA